MNLEDNETEHLFSYGTLQLEEVQLATFGRRLEAQPDTLCGYVLAMTQVRDQNFAVANGAAQRTVKFTGVTSDLVAGFVFVLTRDELKRSDTYEPADYERIQVELKSGVHAWVYLQTTAQ